MPDLDKNKAAEQKKTNYFAPIRKNLPSPKQHLLIWRRAFLNLFAHDGMTSAGNMAFLAMLSLFPFLIFLVTLSGLLGQTGRGTQAINFLLSNLPPEVSLTLKGPIKGVISHAGGEILTGSILASLWTASNGIEAARGALLKAFGSHYGIPFWRRRLESLALVITSALFLIIAMSLLVIAPVLIEGSVAFLSRLSPQVLEQIWPSIWSNISSDTGLDLVSRFAILFEWLSLLVGPFFLFLGMYSAYFALTPRGIKGAYRAPGVFVTLFVLFASAKGLSLYLGYAGNYDLTYGSLAGIVITQFFCFIMAIGFHFGSELNAAYTASRSLKMSSPTG